MARSSRNPPRQPRLRPASTKPPAARHEPSARSRTDLWICLAIGAAVLAIFGQTLRFAFVNYDDPLYVTKNTTVQSGLSLSGTAYAFTSGDTGNWHPVTWLSHMAV